MIRLDRVAIARSAKSGYPDKAPFDPHESYPEYKLGSIAKVSNHVYAAVRESLRLLGLDSERFGTSAWNPLGEIVRPGERVVVKPNFVMHDNLGGGPHDAVVTQPSVLRAVVDYVLIALQGRGSVTIADAPQSDCRFDLLRERVQLDALLAHYSRVTAVPVTFVDVREIIYRYDKEKGFLDRDDRVLQSGDPKGYVDLDVGDRSALEGLEHLDRLYGADYDRAETITAHKPGSHRYRVSRTMLDCDVFISVPKLKIHRKVGITVNYKGLVGINGNKNFIVHHRVGSPAAGGDEFPATAPTADRAVFTVQRFLVDKLLSRKSALADRIYAGALKIYRALVKPFYHPVKTTLRGGDWWGNDTAWRMMVDLATVLTYADIEGGIHDTPQRRLFSIVDGIVGGQNEGPLRPTAHDSRVILAGGSLIVVDAVCARLMGVDYRRMRWLEAVVRGWTPALWPDDVGRVTVDTNAPEWSSLADDRDNSYLSFEPARGWTPVFEWSTVSDRESLNGWIERTRECQEVAAPVR